jgi:hypothetical protein
MNNTTFLRICNHCQEMLLFVNWTIWSKEPDWQRFMHTLLLNSESKCRRWLERKRNRRNWFRDLIRFSSNFRSYIVLNLFILIFDLQKEHNISPGDFPDVNKMRNNLENMDFTKFNAIKPSNEYIILIYIDIVVPMLTFTILFFNYRTPWGCR